MSKQEIRKKYINLRASLSDNEIGELSQKICLRFFSAVDLTSIKVIHTFVPIESKKEVNTWLIIDEVKKRYPDIRISIPRVEDDQLVNFYLEGNTQLTKNKWGITEPLSGEKTLLEEIDLVIVPLLAFDQRGHRIGYGKGYYDRFLSHCRNNCRKIGVSFFDAYAGSIPSDEYDVMLSSAITPFRELTFTN